jgi:hypothetical protein
LLISLALRLAAQDAHFHNAPASSSELKNPYAGQKTAATAGSRLSRAWGMRLSLPACPPIRNYSIRGHKSVYRDQLQVANGLLMDCRFFPAGNTGTCLREANFKTETVFL